MYVCECLYVCTDVEFESNSTLMSQKPKGL